MPRTTHGQASHKSGLTVEYIAWRNMRLRCNDPKCISYPNYGARGVRVCERWQKSFAEFFKDMGPRPSARHSLDRIDHDGNYCPENCRWSLVSEQARSRRTNRIIEFNGQAKCVTDWAKELGISPGTIRIRIDHLGWSIERALTTPSSRKAGRR